MKGLDGSQSNDTAKGVLCASIREGSPTLLLLAMDGKRWILPWIHFLYACYEDLHEFERIELFFSSHDILLEGDRFQDLLKHLSGYKVEWLKAYDKRYQQLCPNELPFIMKIVVEEKSE